METRQTKNTRQQLTPAELEVLQERFEEQQIILARQKEAFASEREKFEKEKRRVNIEKEEEQQRLEMEIEASHRMLDDLREEVAQRNEELQDWRRNKIQNNNNEYRDREEIYRRSKNYDKKWIDCV